ncbi:MAG: hypothetical protein MPL62_00160 [Alphaproteobacteria bacterium]|nr:hypothetical protein [Alphaproteobacteria bacterium]
MSSLKTDIQRRPGGGWRSVVFVRIADVGASPTPDTIARAQYRSYRGLIDTGATVSGIKGNSRENSASNPSNAASWIR